MAKSSMAVQLEEQHNPGDTTIPIKIYFEIPNFYGNSSVRMWIKQCEKCFSLLETPNEQKVDLAYMCMFDKAYVWAQDFICNNLDVEWPEFVKDLCDEFGTIRGDIMDIEEKEFKKWEDSLEEYLSDKIQDYEDFFSNSMEHLEEYVEDEEVMDKKDVQGDVLIDNLENSLGNKGYKDEIKVLVEEDIELIDKKADQDDVIFDFSMDKVLGAYILDNESGKYKSQLELGERRKPLPWRDKKGGSNLDSEILVSVNLNPARGLDIAGVLFQKEVSKPHIIPGSSSGDNHHIGLDWGLSNSDCELSQRANSGCNSFLENYRVENSGSSESVMEHKEKGAIEVDNSEGKLFEWEKKDAQDDVWIDKLEESFRCDGRSRVLLSEVQLPVCSSHSGQLDANLKKDEPVVPLNIIEEVDEDMFIFVMSDGLLKYCDKEESDEIIKFNDAVLRSAMSHNKDQLCQTYKVPSWEDARNLFDCSGKYNGQSRNSWKVKPIPWRDKKEVSNLDSISLGLSEVTSAGSFSVADVRIAKNGALSAKQNEMVFFSLLDKESGEYNSQFKNSWHMRPLPWRDKFTKSSSLTDEFGAFTLVHCLMYSRCSTSTTRVIYISIYVEKAYNIPPYREYPFL